MMLVVGACIAGYGVSILAIQERLQLQRRRAPTAPLLLIVVGASIMVVGVVH